MRWIILYSLAIFSCESSEPTVGMTGVWEVNWYLNNEELSGVLDLKSDKRAELTVDGLPESALIKNKETHSYEWHISQSALELTRADNGIILDFEITDLSERRIKMLLADEIIVILHRK